MSNIVQELNKLTIIIEDIGGVEVAVERQPELQIFPVPAPVALQGESGYSGYSGINGTSGYVGTAGSCTG